MLSEIVIDSFAGGGGASTGIEMALRAMAAETDTVDIAINHNGAALAMHCANHPDTVHLEADIWTVDPLATTKGRPVGLLWGSPDCRHFSKAKGGAPVSDSVRGLAWTLAHWAEQVQPRLIFLENVEEFQTWGPTIIGPKGHLIPDPDCVGETFRQWVGRFKKLGYRVEWRVLRACDYGAPTIRKRLYIIMRRDGEKIRWPSPTHGDPKSPAVKAGKRLPWVTAADIIDWDRPCPSILMDRDEANAYTAATGIRVQRPLAEKTLARIAAGVKRYVLDAAEPFIVTCNHSGGFRGQGLDDPFATVTSARDAHGLVQPFVVSYYGESGGRNERSNPADEPLRTITTEPRHGMVAPFMVPRYGERLGQEPRTRSIDQPMPVIVPTGNGGDLVAPFLAQFNNDSRRIGGVNPGRPADQPLATVTGAGAQVMPVEAELARFPSFTSFYGQDQGSTIDRPVPTVMTKDKHGVVDTLGAAPPLSDDQLNRARQVASFLRAHDAWDDREFVTVGDYIVVDIGMRMLTPRELARAQGFPEGYKLAVPYKGGVLSESDQRHKIGNSVCPPVAAAIVGANYRPQRRVAESAPQGWLFESEAA